MKGKIIVPIVCIALIMGMLSGCVEEEPTNNAPVASFTASVVNKTATFTDASSDADGDTLTYTWDFGDGNTSTLENPEHTYAEDNKTYTVTLTVTDDDGATDTKTDTVTIGTPPEPVVLPTAAFTYEPMTNITVNMSVNFTDASTLGDATNLTWLWDFGDDTNSTQQNPSHMYTAAATYNVTLTVTDETDATLTDTSDPVAIVVTEAT